MRRTKRSEWALATVGYSSHSGTRCMKGAGVVVEAADWHRSAWAVDYCRTECETKARKTSMPEYCSCRRGWKEGAVRRIVGIGGNEADWEGVGDLPYLSVAAGTVGSSSVVLKASVEARAWKKCSGTVSQSWRPGDWEAVVVVQANYTLRAHSKVMRGRVQHSPKVAMGPHMPMQMAEGATVSKTMSRSGSWS